MKISVVIPTRNRPADLKRVLWCIANQSHPAEEIIVVDSSDDKSPVIELKKDFSFLPIVWLDSAASVCIQRNLGIGRASCEWVFLCDDDIEFAQDYFQVLSEFALEKNCGAVSGLWMQLENNRWVSQYPVRNFSALLWRYVFQLPVWGDINIEKVNQPFHRVYHNVRKFYRNRGNTTSLAGWPLITTQNDSRYFITKIYSLGACIVRRRWLESSPYDEVLDPSGIGDNYGVEIGFPENGVVHVLRSALVYHHRAAANRLVQVLSYYRRVLALQYFIKKGGDRVLISTLWFVWSLTGNVLLYTFKGNLKMVHATIKAILLIVTGRNPYWLAFKQGKKTIQPVI